MEQDPCSPSANQRQITQQIRQVKIIPLLKFFGYFHDRPCVFQVPYRLLERNGTESFTRQELDEIFILEEPLTNQVLPSSPKAIIAAQAPAIKLPGLLPAIVGDTYNPPDHSVTARWTQTTISTNFRPQITAMLMLIVSNL